MAVNRLRVTEVEDEVKERGLKGKKVPSKKAPWADRHAKRTLAIDERMEESASVNPARMNIVPTIRTQKVLDREITTHQSQEVSTYTFKGEEIVRILIAHGYIPADGPTRTVFLRAEAPKGVSGRPLLHGDDSSIVFESTRPLSLAEASKFADSDDWDDEDEDETDD